MNRLLLAIALVSLSACTIPGWKNDTLNSIHREMDADVQAGARSSKATEEAVNNALLPPLSAGLPASGGTTPEARFDLAVNNLPASQVFAAIVSGTRFSMLVSPDVHGSISVNLKDVTVFDALEAIREMYGYDYKVDGNRIYILPLTLQTRIFQVNYLTGSRKGESQVRVTSGSVSDTPIAGLPGAMPLSTTIPGTTTRPQDSSKVNTSTNENFWDDLRAALDAIVGTGQGRKVVISPMSGVIVIRAMPDELRSVAAYLKAAQISVERQVILEAKIIDVQLNDSFQTGINWSAFSSNKAGGIIGPGTSLSPSVGGVNTPITGPLLSGTVGSNVTTPAANPGAMFGLVFQTSRFAALLNFLETQGDVHVLSSPRIATLNDQKAVLKVGTDEFFVTNVTTNTVVGTATTIAPSVTLQPFFSGIALDVTPSIDQNDDIILHVHPSVSQVTTVTKVLDLGTAGTLTLPLASSDVSETDSIIRTHDGQIVAIGGLMRQATTNDESGIPWLPKGIFGQTNATIQKRELVILLKATVVNSNNDWTEDIAHRRDEINEIKR